MKVKNLFNSECVRIRKAGEGVYRSDCARSIPKKCYNYTINKVCSFPNKYSGSCIDIFIK